MKNTIIKFGVYSLLTASILFLLSFLLGENLDYDMQAVVGYASMVISLLFVFFGIKHYRDHENDGKVSLAKAIVIGLLISLFAALGFAIVDYIYTTQINPDFASEYLAHSIKEMEATLSPTEFEEQKKTLTKQMEDYGSPIALASMMFVTVTIIGFIISLISGLILQRK